MDRTVPPDDGAGAPSAATQQRIEDLLIRIYSKHSPSMAAAIMDGGDPAAVVDACMHQQGVVKKLTAVLDRAQGHHRDVAEQFRYVRGEIRRSLNLNMDNFRTTRTADQSAKATLAEKDRAIAEQDRAIAEQDRTIKSIHDASWYAEIGRQFYGLARLDMRGSSSDGETCYLATRAQVATPAASMVPLAPTKMETKPRFPKAGTFDDDDHGDQLEAAVGKYLRAFKSRHPDIEYAHTAAHHASGFQRSPDFTRFMTADCVEWTACAVSYVEVKSFADESKAVRAGLNRLCWRLTSRYSYWDVLDFGAVTMRCALFTRTGFYPVSVVLKPHPHYVKCTYSRVAWSDRNAASYVESWLFAHRDVTLTLANAGTLPTIGEYQTFLTLRRNRAKPGVYVALRAAAAGAGAAPADPKLDKLAEMVVLKQYVFVEEADRTKEHVRSQLRSAIHELSALQRISARPALRGGKWAANLPTIIDCVGERNAAGQPDLRSLTIVTAPVGIPLCINSTTKFLRAGHQLLQALSAISFTGVTCHGDISASNIVELPHLKSFCLIDWGEAAVLETARRESTEGNRFAVTMMFAHPSLSVEAPVRTVDTDAYSVVMSLIYARGFAWEGGIDADVSRNTAVALAARMASGPEAAAMKLALKESNWGPGDAITGLQEWRAAFRRGAPVPVYQERPGPPPDTERYVHSLTEQLHRATAAP